MEFRNISTELRKILKDRKITYKELAQKLGLSESGVKKILTGEDISYNRLGKLLKLADVDLKTLLGLSFDDRESLKLSKDQELFLAENFEVFNFYVQLERFRMDTGKLKRRHPKLSKKRIGHFLKQLEQVGMIRRDGEKVVSMATNGIKLGKRLAEAYDMNFHRLIFEKLNDTEGIRRQAGYHGIGQLKLSKASYLQFRAALRGVVDEFHQRSLRDGKILDREDTVDVGFILAALPISLDELHPIKAL